MTDGEVDKTVSWARQFEVKYPIAYDQSFFCMRSGIFVYPHAILVDPAGITVWSGHPTKVNDELIEKHLEGALPAAIPDWPADVLEAGKLFLAGQFQAAFENISKVVAAKPENKIYDDQLRSLWKRKLGAIDRMAASGDYLAAWENAYVLGQQAEGFDGKPDVDSRLEVMAADEKVKAGYEVQNNLRTLAARPLSKLKEVLEVIDAMDKLANANKDTIAEKDARLAILYLNRLMDAGYYKSED